MKEKILWTVMTFQFGCGDSSSLPEITDEGIHIVVAADPELDLCAGSLAQMDEFVVRVAREFSIAPPEGSERLQFYWLASTDFFSRTPCDESFTACARRPGTVYSKAAPFNHELVHAVAYAFGHPPLILCGGPRGRVSRAKRRQSLTHLCDAG